jgi:Protein of unknown function (DUF1552)
MTEPKKLLSRRLMLRGAGGLVLGLPFLDAAFRNKASAQAIDIPPYAIFFRQANGVAAAQTAVELGTETEKFWPREVGPLDAANVEGRALAELGEYLDRMLVVGNVNMKDFDFGDGHARGALQLLTARGPLVEAEGGDSEAGGESLDHRIGRQVNAGGVESLVLYAGGYGGWLGGPCISHRSAGVRRTAQASAWDAYQAMVGVTGGQPSDVLERIRKRNQSVNDLVREELGVLLSRSDLSQNDRERLDLHLSSIRDFEINVSCRLTEDEESRLDGAPLASTDGNVVLEMARLHMDITAIAIACGYTRSASIQVGDGNDSQTRFWVDGNQLENYHYISHRRLSHDATGDIIPGSDLLHHEIDKQFAQTFKHLLDKLDAYKFESGSLLTSGVSCWMNDLGNGPAHSPANVPMILVGNSQGYFKTGQYIRLSDRAFFPNHARVLNAIATATGCTSEGKDYCDDLGDDDFPDKSPHPELLA